MPAPRLLTADAVAAAVYLSTVGFSLFGAGAGDSGGCQRGCDLALASFVVHRHDTLYLVAARFNISDCSVIRRYSPSITDVNLLISGQRISIPFRCECIGSSHLAGVFLYHAKKGDTYQSIAGITYSNLTTVDSLLEGNPQPVVEGSIVRVEVSCSCGDESIPLDYTVFTTYSMGGNESISLVANDFEVPIELLNMLNPGRLKSDGIIFVPLKGISAIKGSSGPSKTRFYK